MMNQGVNMQTVATVDPKSHEPGMFPRSLLGYVERALTRCRDHCKDDTNMAACKAVMKEVITKANADGTLHTRDWDNEPLFPLQN